jgi:hypothetical protein
MSFFPPSEQYQSDITQPHALSGQTSLYIVSFANRALHLFRRFPFLRQMTKRKRIRKVSISSDDGDPMPPSVSSASQVSSEKPAMDKKAKFDRRYATEVTSPEEVLGSFSFYLRKFLFLS